MARAETIIVGGGISASQPFTAGQVPVIVTADPPAVTDSIVRQVDVAGVLAIVVGTDDPDAAATEQFRTKGGFISGGAGDDSLILGQGSTAAGEDAISMRGVANAQDSIVIGRSAFGNGIKSVQIGQGAGNHTTVGAGVAIGGTALTMGDGIAIGSGASVSVNAGTDSPVAIGAGAQCTSVAAGANGIAIGKGVINAGTNCINIGGNGSAAAGNRSVSVGGTPGGIDFVVAIGIGATVGGAGGIAIGEDAVVGAHAGSIAIGNGAVTTAADQCVIDTGANVFTFGPTFITLPLPIRGPDGAVGAPAYSFTSDPNTGMYSGGADALGFATAGVQRVLFDAGGGAGLIGLGIWSVDHGAVQRVSVGANDSGGAGFRLLRIANS